MRSKHLVLPLLTAFCLVIGVLLYGTHIPVNADVAKSPLKVGFMLVGATSDMGFNYAHNQGRLYLESHLKGKAVTDMVEKVPESAEAERVLDKMISQGDRLIFTPSYGFLEPMMRVAKRHPEVTFMQINRWEPANNVGCYISNLYEPMYIAGIVGGRMTKTNKLGFIAAHPVPPLIQAVNAFTMGARSVNPKATVKVIWINNWSDPVLEAEAVKSLAENKVDIIAHQQDNQTTILKAAEQAKIYVIGFYSDAHQLAPTKWLTGACLEWGPFYTRIAQQVIDGKWKPMTYNEGLGGDYTRLAPFGPEVPAAVRKEALAAVDKIEKGKLVVFQGPLADRDGKQQLAAGQKGDIHWLREMNFFVPGVDATLPRNK